MRCSCGSSLLEDPSHFLSCNLLKATVLNLRHNLVSNCLSTWATRLGAACVVEPSGLDPLSLKRPDILICLPHTSYLVDVSIRHPTAPSNLRLAHQPLAVVKQAEQRKHAKYDQMAAAINSAFVPFIMETHGGYGPEALKLISDLVPPDTSPLDNLYPLHQTAFDLRSSLAIALQRGNAHAVMVGLSHARAAVSAPLPPSLHTSSALRFKRRRTH